MQDALDDARTVGDLDAEIWSAAGTYKPDRGTGDQTLAFELFGSIALYGGFSGWEECRDDRNPGVNITTLSGDLNDDDDPGAAPLSDCCLPTLPAACSDADCRAAVVALDPGCGERWRQGCTARAIELCCELCRPTRCDNSYNVLRATDPASTAPILDGLNIVHGEAFDPKGTYGRAGGLYALGGGPSVTGCHFLRNRPEAADFVTPSGTLLLERTSFVDNGMEFPNFDAVVIYDPADGITISHLLVSNNGGGVVSDEPVWIIDSRFLRNSGNAVYTFYGAVVVNSVFAGNTGQHGAAVQCSSAYVLTVLSAATTFQASQGSQWVMRLQSATRSSGATPTTAALHSTHSLPGTA